MAKHTPETTLGKRFGSVVITDFLGRDKNSHVRVRIECDCGNSKEVPLGCLLKGDTKSCGCLRKEKPTKHGHSTGSMTPTYRSWRHMRQRCDNPNDHAYADYGGRGVSYDPRWSDFACFLEDMGERPEGKTLDKDSIKPGNLYYCKEFCCWADSFTQNQSRRGVVF